MTDPPLPARSPLRPRAQPVRRTPTPDAARVVPTQRQHALNELLASEKAYASDLAIVRQVHIPLALGQSIQIDSTLLTSTVEAPMSAEDVKIIFSNIEEVSSFANKFCESLHAAIQADMVGKLFLDSIPDMEPPYKGYISKHESASSYYHSLPHTPALTAYHMQTRTIASSMSHAWDLHSMLIKPVQRLLKYPLLLATIFDETPDGHPDKENLRLAKDAVQNLAYRVNEERRRAEVVKNLLKKTNRDQLVRIKNLKPAPPPDSDESIRVAHHHTQLLRLQTFANQLAQDILHWSHAVTICSSQLRTFAESFANTIGLSPEVQSDSFDAFMSVLTDQIIPMATTLSQSLSSTLLSPLSALLDTINSPLHLLDTLQNSLLPLHNHLLHMPLSQKNRPPPDLINASAEYLALRSKLAEEIPIYLSKSERVLAGCIVRLARIQKEYFHQTHSAWSTLWTQLRVEGEDINSAHTVKVWWDRWEEVDSLISGLQLVQQSLFPPTPPRSSRTSASSSSLSNGTSVVTSVLSSLEPIPPTKRAKSLPVKPLNNASNVRFGKSLAAEYEYDIGYDYVTALKSPLDSLIPPGRRKGSPRRPVTSSGTSPTSIQRKLSFRRKTSDPSLRETGDVLYLVESVFAFEPPLDPRVKKSKAAAYTYDSYPFVSMKGEGEVFEVLKAAGHPREHLSRGLMLYVDDGGSDEPDSLLLVRRRTLKGPKQKSGHGEVGWALASYLRPLNA